MKIVCRPHQRVTRRALFAAALATHALAIFDSALAAESTAPSAHALSYSNSAYRPGTETRSSAEALPATLSSGSTVRRAALDETSDSASSSDGSSVTIQRLSAEEIAAANSGSGVSDAYVDQLIDPGAIDRALAVPHKSRRYESELYQSIEAAAYYRDTFEDRGDALDTGIDYFAVLPTTNYGDLRLNLVALNEDKNDFFNQGDSLAVGSFSNKRQQGLRRYSLAQLGLPLSEALNMDNIIGTHRQSRNIPLRSRIGIVNQRFGGNEPDILGLTSRIYSRTTGVALSTGELGDTLGTVLPGFVKTDGRVHRLLGHHMTDFNSFTADLWNTTGKADDDLNRVGSRMNWQSIWRQGFESTATLANSDDNLALLLGLSQQRGNGLRHEGGLYYFEPDFIWVDTKIGDDFVGGYYRFNHNYRTVYYNGTFEYRRDGLEDSTKRERDTLFATLNANYRLDRNSSMTATYTLRDIDDRSGQPFDISSTEHTVRGMYTLQHSRNTRSSVGVTLRERERDSFQRINYDLFHSLTNDSSADLRLEYNREDGDSFASDRYRVDIGWQRYFLYGGTLGIGAGYSYGDYRNGSDDNWNGYLNYDINFAARWSFSAQLDYNFAEFERDIVFDPDDLFTGEQFDEFDALRSEQFTALFSLRYSIGGNAGGNVLAANGVSRGSGRVIGRLFVDSNGDGVAQPNERGLQGVTIYLNSVYPIITNERGEFEYPAVGPGEHHIFVDEALLPLPWSLNGEEYRNVQVRLRGTTRVEIPVRKL